MSRFKIFKIHKCRLLEASRSFELKASGIISCEKLVFVSDIKTPVDKHRHLCMRKGVRENIASREKLNIPRTISHSGWIQKIFCETLFGASRVSRNINGSEMGG